jgi:hypothetical protein
LAILVLLVRVDRLAFFAVTTQVPREFASTKPLLTARVKCSLSSDPLLYRFQLTLDRAADWAISAC